ncbi:HAD family phosphatase [termite gut metagenome]|uniref:HAD family phosphatase n=1 Tax=termite gut metagenome TaxID=433724 RepID=A0A5J4QLR3_9ZZZZ
MHKLRMEISGIKNLLIDFGGVLVNLDRQACLNNFKSIGIEDIASFIDPYRQQGAFMQLEKGLITLSEFRDELRELSKKPVTDEQIDDAWNSFLVDIPVSKLDLLLKLREQYVVYLVSNTNLIHWEWACQNAFPHKGFRVEDYFDKQFLSFEMHCAKPEVELFQKVLEETAIIPEETLFIDDAEANCKAAQSLGIHTYMAKARENWGHLFE